ncbi:MAG TPA: hypothetical protein VLU96_08820 [Gaiellaceae bacterium]|nr:hypothetical protein [Gaiellaceae bacterium]
MPEHGALVDGHRAAVQAVEELLGLLELQAGVTVAAEAAPDALRAAAALLEVDPVGRNELGKLREELAFERVLAAEALGLCDEREDPLGIATCERRHVSKDTSIDVSTPVRARGTLRRGTETKGEQ